MGIFKKKEKQKSDIELIEEWTPKLKKFAEENNVDVLSIDMDKYTLSTDLKKMVVMFQIQKNR